MKDSIEYKLQQYFFNIEDEEEVYAKRRFDEVVLYFENENEKLAFEYYIEGNQKVVESYLIEAHMVYFTVDTGNKKEANVCRHRLSTGLVLNKVLQEFRGYYGL